MRKLLITLDDELDPWLEKKTNQAETVRKALRLYKGNIETGTVEGLRSAFKNLQEKLDRIDHHVNENYERIKEIHNKATGDYQ